ncbi:MAG TPA: DDE-type integrase/transposase/recombinase [Terriglobales bacterium]|nr:DDE-type integrase/transposase/recombinase [Terriglobales bacterium]
MNQLSTTKRAQVIAALIEGNSINSTCRMLGVGKRTVLRLLEDAGCACAAFHDAIVRGLTVTRAQCDEVWSFVYAKQKNVTAEQMEQGAGDCWTWTAIDADTKLIISYMLGDRGAGTAKAFMQDVASRIDNRIQLTTDGHRVYAEAVEQAFGSEIDYAMLVKIYGASHEGESRYSPATCIGCRTGVLSGRPDPKYISTSYVERQNLSMRMGMRRFTRLTNGFSKKFENHAHQVALYFFHYNFCRVHKTLRVTPAMEAGLTNHVWTLEELCALLPEKKPNARADKEMVLKALERTA